MKVLYKNILIFIPLIIIAQQPDTKPIRNKLIDEIRIENIMSTVEYLASEELEGRLSGSPGFFRAAEFAADEFNRIGLKKGFGESYYQTFLVEYNEILSPNVFELYIESNKTKSFSLGEDYVYRGFTGSGDLIADVVFCGYGLSIPENGYDDYSGVDVRGKIVMVFKQNPTWKIENINWGNGYPREKSKTAFDHGAKGILFVSTPNSKNPQKTIGSVLAGEGEQIEYFPQLHISIESADNFLINSGYTLSRLQYNIDSNKKPYSVELNTTAKIIVKTNYSKEKETVNIAGLFEGTKKKDEYIVVGAHLDHVGKQGDKIYFPGANDNASGSAAVLEFARIFALNKIQTERSIIFVLFSSEEAGLFGSKQFVENPPVPLNSIYAMLNFDCIGHGDSIQIGGGGKSKDLWNLIKSIDAENYGLMIDRTWDSGGADAQPFADAGINTAYFVTTNSYTHLHYMTDKPNTLNPLLFEKITKLGFLTILKLAVE